MQAKRKKQMRLRQDRQDRRDFRKYEILDRLLTFLGIHEIFMRLPNSLYEVFIDMIRPGIEVEADEESLRDPLIKEARRVIASVVKKPLNEWLDDRRFYLAFEDVYRGHRSLVDGIECFEKKLRPERGPRLRPVWEALAEAKAVLESNDQDWVNSVMARVSYQVPEVTEFASRIHGRIIETELVAARKPEGRPCLRIVLRLHEAESRIVTYRGSSWKAYPCRRSVGLSGMQYTRWNCREYGVEGPNVDLPVYVSEHALGRLHERLPLRGYVGIVQSIMMDSLSFPVFLPQDVDEYLIEARMGNLRVGYFVAKIFPHLVLIKTFLFLTMNGTPEGELLRNKLGLSMKKIQEYKLDQFFTLVGSDIKSDPLFSKIFQECGCSHLFTLIDTEHRLSWSDCFGDRFKKEFDLRESGEGYKLGQKWVRWQDSGAAAG